MSAPVTLQKSRRKRYAACGDVAGLDDMDTLFRAIKNSQTVKAVCELGCGNLPLVETRGVEPLSEDRSYRLSPSADHALTFPLPALHGHSAGFSSFINPTCGKAYAGWFPTLMTPSTRGVGTVRQTHSR